LCLEEALKYTEEEIKAAEKRLAERKSQVEQTQAQPARHYIDRDNLAAALEMVKKRVAI